MIGSDGWVRRGKADGGTETRDLLEDYYPAIDWHRYEQLPSVLTPRFPKVPPDRTIEAPDAFVRFMPKGRPEQDTLHPVRAYATGPPTPPRTRLI